MTLPVAPGLRAGWRLGIGLWLLGLPGVVAVVWALLPPLTANEALLPAPLWVVVLLSGLQTAVLLAAAVAVGTALAPRVGLRAPALSAWGAGRPVAPALRPQWMPGLVGGALGALWLVLLSHCAPDGLRPADSSSAMPLVVKLLYGGITEELLVRWGAMSLLLWLPWRVVQRGQGAPRPVWVALAVVLSALLFAVGHLPAALAMAGALTPDVLVFVLVGNTAFGLLAGALFARWGLEAAMLAHVLAHALAHPWV
ncbi:CPBP family intramembrane glutamic endopeptidase [Paracidovorax sp. MALMAid1276]|uniref:CPBP family intramembrane glutamic endopeptidase n=1 Tax=Paracidovorax sp. MALMAid1276 TaxID=3411631 RepID=UPI003B9B7A3C